MFQARNMVTLVFDIKHDTSDVVQVCISKNNAQKQVTKLLESVIFNVSLQKEVL